MARVTSDSSYGKPYDRLKARTAYVLEVQKRIDATEMAGTVMSRMVDEFMHSINQSDMEEYASGLKLSQSYTTLHDHQFGEEILGQTDIERRFLAFCGAEGFKELFGGGDASMNGTVAVHLAGQFADMMDASFKVRGYGPRLVRAVSVAVKSSDWWGKNGAVTSDTLRRNRKRLNRIRDVQDS